MPQDTTCPGCSHVFPVSEARGPFTVPCPRCETDLTVEFKKPAAPPEAGQPPYDLVVRKGALPDAPAVPQPSKRSRDDDDDEPVQKSGNGIVILSGVLGTLFVVLGLGLTTWLLFFEIDTDTETASTTTKTNNRSNNSNNNSGGNKSGNNNSGGNKGTKGTNPGGGGGDPWVPPPPPPKPKDEFSLTPVIGTQQLISAPALESDPYTVPLPAQLDQVAVGGNGRYIVMHLPKRQRLAVFDVNTLKLTESDEPSDGQGTLIAAGQNRMVTAHNNVLRVWSLPDLKRRFDTSGLQLPHGIQSMAMGSATNGPLIVSGVFGHGALLEVSDSAIKTVDGSAAEFGGGINARLRASANGKLFLRGGYGFDEKTVLLSESRRKWQTITADLSSATPSADARWVYGFSGITRDGGQQVGAKVGGPGSQTWYVPAVTAGISNHYFLRLRETKVQNKQTVTVTVHKSQTNPEREKAVDLGVLPELDGMVNFFFRNTVPFDQHLFLVPEAKVLIVIPNTKDKIIVRRVELR